ncbi:uncharacterized protein TNIN_281531 [Trichonephila inaurata madagascariensis]|uniref:Uncharacterized protein n=1 Tax=Trichonephila inaurata madagascariensis TaxID=2747483 RepID=A0A8X6WQ15_9ARAC|nr:uncharacterized protein TNIN_281531 [Trichonephila inaurata madagascariensis]
MKSMKKTGTKIKQPGSKGSKSDDKHPKSKSETETVSKDLTELEKEMFSIKITDLEARLNRKQQLCAFMEEEKNFFEAEYESKKVLKKESMQFLNQAYQDFHLELLLLKDELSGMEDMALERTLKSTEIEQISKKIEELKEMEQKLEKKLYEAEKNVDDISNLVSKLEDLQEQISKKNEHFEIQISDLNADFKSFIESLKEQLNTLIEGLIKDKSLKLHLLPLPYQALFESGMLGSIWFESVLGTCENLIQQNTETSNNLLQIKQASNKAKEASQNAISSIIFTNEAKELISHLSAELNFSKDQEYIYSNLLQKYKSQMKYIIQLNNKNLALKQDTTHLANRIESLEKEIKQKEIFEDDFEENYRFLKIIMKVKDVIIKEL